MLALGGAGVVAAWGVPSSPGGTVASTTTSTEPAPPPEDQADGTPTGTVLIRQGTKFVRLRALRRLRLGTELDTRKGRITLRAHDRSRGSFYGGRFKLARGDDTPLPGRRARRLLALVLTGGDFTKCKSRTTAGAGVVAVEPVRYAWGNASGSFRTTGRFAAATVRGTLWRTADFCNGTEILVKRGKVDVIDRVKHKHVLVTAGHSYMALAKRS